jgi:predicted nuclease of predicted toxin-antitoxin system
VRVLADECCPRAIVLRLRSDGHDVRYAAETNHRADDIELLKLSVEESRLIVTEDFDFGDLVVRDRLPAFGIVLVYLPEESAIVRAGLVSGLLARGDLTLERRITVLANRRIRQRPID